MTDEFKPDPETLVGVLRTLATAVNDLETYADASAALEPQAQADTIALLQDLRRRVGLVESEVSAALGRVVGKFVGSLSDGRQFTLNRTADRKEWDHEDWKRDARRAVVENVQEAFTVSGGEGLVNLATGEEVTLGQVLQVAVAQAQEVHGSTAPRSTSLKRLGLFASDYCTSSPGGWRLNAVAPTQTTTETDQEN